MARGDPRVGEAAGRLRVPRAIVQAIVAHAEAELPNECCGVLAGRNCTVAIHYPLQNALASPRLYESDPRSLFVAHRDMRDRGLEMLAVYHSHPTTAPVPSWTDLANNLHGKAIVHFIVSLTTTPPTIRGWHLGETIYREAEWELIDDDASTP
jgi:proteasome lid subunit RPN8/RPN11